MYICIVFNVYFVGLLFFLKRCMQQNKEYKHHIKGKNNTLLFSCLTITTDLLSQLIFYRAPFEKTSCSLHRFGLSYLFYVSFL